MTDTWLLASGSIVDKPELLGHTEIAIEYSGRRASNSDYEVVWWIRADQVEQVRSVIDGMAPLSKVRGALERLSDQRFFYGDLKPENMVIALHEKSVVFDLDNFDPSAYIQDSRADFPYTDVAATLAAPDMWLGAGQGSTPESIAPLSAQFNAFIRQLAHTLASRSADTLAEDALQNACYQVRHAVQGARQPTATRSLEPASYVVVSGSFVADTYQALTRYIDSVIMALRLKLVRILAALSRRGDFIDFILAIIAVFLHYGHRHEPGDDDSLLARRNWTSLGSVPAIS